jgi:hypothetical protein
VASNVVCGLGTVTRHGDWVSVIEGAGETTLSGQIAITALRREA